ncbi:MAG TPA: sodium:solute symporter family protein [Syntrophales bacterium]|nr:sodium:solute symporter family protein [Syntrophales bacterium]HQN78263.1 sodium:solute symporter family protein [Syntrophales bacterium]HQQ27893.1 sodium:solute symporter family protein [Syntrophales bacterium]
MNGTILAVFFLAMLAIGGYSAMKIKGPASYFVADRSGGSLLISGSLLATILGGSSTIGLAGLGYQKGLVGAWWLLVGSAGLLLLAFWLSRKIREYAVYTLPEILEKQYGGKTTRVSASVVIAAAWLGIIAGQIIAAGKILSTLWPGHLEGFMALAAAVFVVYTILGGQYSILRTDSVQSVIIFCGILLALFLGMSAAGGWESLTSNVPAAFLDFPTSQAFGARDLLMFLLFVGAAYLVGPDMYSRILCARTPAVARRSLIATAAVLIPAAFALTLTGMAARVLLPGIPPESAFPALVMKVVPAGLNGLILAALLAAVMSSADTCLLTTGTIVTADILQPLCGRRLEERTLLRLSRISVAVLGVLSLLLALKMKGVIATLLLGYTVYSGGLIVPVILGFYSRRLKLNPFGVMTALIGGGGASLFLKLGNHSDLLLLTFPLSAFLLFAGSLGYRIFVSRFEGDRLSFREVED